MRNYGKHLERWEYQTIYLYPEKPVCMLRNNSYHGLQHTRPPFSSPIPRASSNSCPLSQWCHPTISSSCVLTLCDLWTVARQASLSVGFRRQEYCCYHMSSNIWFLNKTKVQHIYNFWILDQSWLCKWFTFWLQALKCHCCLQTSVKCTILSMPCHTSEGKSFTFWREDGGLAPAPLPRIVTEATFCIGHPPASGPALSL